MKRDLMLTITSLFSLFLLVVHLAHDIVYGFEQGGLAILVAIVTVPVIWLCAALLLAERRSGHIIMLLGGLLSAYVPYVHMSGKGIGAFAKANGAFFLVWTLLMLGVTGGFTVILALRGLWTMRKGHQT